MVNTWFAIHTLSGHEKKVSELMISRAKLAGLWEQDIVEILIPTEPELTTRNGKRVVVQKKLFPGYLFVRMNLNDDVFKCIKGTSGVTGFLQSGSKPVPVSEAEIARIQRNIEVSAEAPRVNFSKGDIVRVIEGPFVDYTGKIEEVNSEKETLSVMINIFGRDTPVKLEFTGVEKQ
ncbi:MAG: transcription termination/antitermination factor NusG [Fimbriimonadaceae bacterium]|nr:transcription termination/antitermination factor NusG [Fimbriimonadaceae bacterium]